MGNPEFFMHDEFVPMGGLLGFNFDAPWYLDLDQHIYISKGHEIVKPFIV